MTVANLQIDPGTKELATITAVESTKVDILAKEFEVHFLSVGSNGAMEEAGEDVLSTLGASQSNNTGL